MLDKEFVPYQESLELKGLEFDEECFAMYMKDVFKHRCWCKNSEFEDKILFTSAPTFSQAFRWFREKYELHHLDLLSLLFLEQKMNYEEAELACLRKLIEIVKQQKLNHDLMSGDIVGY